MQPSQLALLPVYYIENEGDPVHFVHVIDVISIEYARKFNLESLYRTMLKLNARCAIRTAESHFAIWIPRGGIDSFSLLDERIPSSRRGKSVFVHNDGCHYSMWKARQPERGEAKVA